MTVSHYSHHVPGRRSTGLSDLPFNGAVEAGSLRFYVMVEELEEQ